MIEIYVGRSKVGSKYFKEIPDKTIFEKYIADCKRDFEDLSEDVIENDKDR